MEVSVIITNYNYGRYLSRSIRSIINQSYNSSEYEIIVVDDCSSDNSSEVIRNFKGYIRSILNKQNIGIAASCNIAIKQALGKFVIRVDADDYVHRDFLKVHHLFLSHNKDDIDATSSDYYEVDINENIIRRKNGVTYPTACGVMYKTDDIIELGLYDETIPREDVEFRSRFLKSGRHIYNIPIPLYRYSQHVNSITKSGI